MLDISYFLVPNANTMYPTPSLEFTSKNWALPEGTLPVFDRHVQHLPMKDIILIQGDGNYTLFHCSNGRRIMVSKTLRDYEKLMTENSSFFRVHKSYLINLAYVQRYDVKGEDCVWMKNGQIISIARRRKHQFAAFMRQYLGL